MSDLGCVAIFVLFSCQISYSVRDYYWREYTGEIPIDAIVGGKDANGKGIYIGQAYVHYEGLVVVQITPGVRRVSATMHGIKHIDKYVKILCGSQEKVYWMSTNPKNLQLDLIDKHAIIGGHGYCCGSTSIGRINYHGEVKIGKINSYSLDTPYFYFNNNGVEEKVKTSYQILMYKD
jgi:hypothetical protein